jgi:hypothetical protein
MRTTLTLEPDIASRIEQEVRHKGRSLKAVVNDALRRGLGMTPPEPVVTPFRVQPHSFGFRPGIDLDKLNQLVDELEIEEAKGLR